MNDILLLLYWKSVRLGVRPTPEMLESHRSYQERRRRKAGIKPKKIGSEHWRVYHQRRADKMRARGLTLEGKPRVNARLGLSKKKLGHARYMAEWRKLRETK